MDNFPVICKQFKCKVEHWAVFAFVLPFVLPVFAHVFILHSVGKTVIITMNDPFSNTIVGKHICGCYICHLGFVWNMENSIEKKRINSSLKKVDLCMFENQL